MDNSLLNPFVAEPQHGFFFTIPENIGLPCVNTPIVSVPECNTRSLEHNDTKITSNTAIRMPSISGIEDGDRRRRDFDKHGKAAATVELQVETMSTNTTRIFLISWYVILIIALVIQIYVGFQWSMRNFCDADSCSFKNLSMWNSSACLQSLIECVPENMATCPSLNPRIPSLRELNLMESNETIPRQSTSKMKRSMTQQMASDEMDTYTRREDNHSLFPCKGLFEELPADAVRETGKSRPVHSNGLLQTAGFALSTLTNMDATKTGLSCPPNTTEVHFMRWEGINFGDLVNVKLNRFAHLVLSLGSPMTNITPPGSKQRTYELLVLLDQVPSSDAWSIPGDGGSLSSTAGPSLLFSNTSLRYVYQTFVTCHFDESRCATVIVPPSVALATTNSTYTLTLLNVDAELWGAAASDSFVGLIYQREVYTLATIIWRYGGIHYTLLLMVRFITYSRHTRMLYEQYCVLLLQLGLILYLNPFFGFSIYTTGALSVWLHFFEFHIPIYFAALLVCFMFAVFTATIDWNVTTYGSDKDRKEEEPSEEGTGDGVGQNKSGNRGHHAASRISVSCDSRDSLTAPGGTGGIHTPPPIWVRLGLLAYFTLVVCLDIFKAFHEDWSWGTESFCTTHVCLFLRYAIHAVLLAGFFLTGVAFFWMKRNLSRRSYLESRPQQLAGRILIFLFTSSIVYIFTQAYLVNLLYPQILTIAYFQPLLQLSPLTVNIFFVNHMTFVYTTMSTSKIVPIRPDDAEWKRITWLRRWFHWLRCHGGCRYIFLSESEERQFYAIQDGTRWPNATSGRNDVHHHRIHQYHHHNRHCGEDGGVLPRADLTRCFDEVGRRLGYESDGSDSPTETSRLVVDDTKEEKCRAEGYRCFRRMAGAATKNSSATRGSAHFSKNTSVNMEDDQDTVSIFSIDYHSSEASFRELDPHFPLMEIREGGVLASEGSFPTEVAGGKRRLDHQPHSPMRGEKIRQKKAVRDQYHFFNLETAIDCFNMSWEAYAVEVKNALRKSEMPPTEEESTPTERVARRVLTYFFDWRNTNNAMELEGNSPLCEATADFPAPGPLGGRETNNLGALTGAALCHQPTSLYTHALPTDRPCSPAPCKSHANSQVKQRSVAEDSSESNKCSPNRRGHVAGTDSCSANTETTTATFRPQGVLQSVRFLCPGRFGYKLLAVIEVCEMQVIITQLDTTLAHHVGKAPRIVVAFRGTHNVMNALHGLRVRKRVWKEMDNGALRPDRRACVHSGILELWMSLNEKVLSTVLTALGRDQEGNHANPEGGGNPCSGDNHRIPCTESSSSSIPFDTNWPRPLPGMKEYYSVYTTGHSLGGALACLCAYSLHRALSLAHYPNTGITVYTFGQPRFTNRIFKRLYDRAVPRTFRVVNEDDAVSYFNVFSGHHVGIEVDIDRRGNYICRPTMVERTFRPTSGLGFAVRHHTLEAYASSLNAIADRHASAVCPVRCITSYIYPIANREQSTDE